MNPAVTITDIHKHYPGVHALQGVDFSIGRGEFFGLLGPNGAGKSTLINILAGLTRADAGHAAILGHDVIHGYRAARHALGVVPQELLYDPFFSVREVLRLQAGYFGHGREYKPWLDELLATLSLTDKADTSIHALSGGMKRRVLIALALAHKPQVLVLDEPTAGVDTELRRMLWEFTRRLHREGVTVVLTTHYLDEAQRLADRVAVIRAGRIIRLGTPAELIGDEHPLRERRVREAERVDDVTHRPDTAHVRAAVVVDDDEATLVDLDAGRVERDALGHRCTSDRDEDQIGLQRLLTLRRLDGR